MQKTISILGSTGSIGTQALDVARKMGFKVAALAAGKNIETLEKQVREFLPKIVAVADENAANELKLRLKDLDVKVIGGSDAVIEAATVQCDTVLNAIVGINGLKPTMAAIETSHDIALANKETLVTAGDIVMKRAAEKGVTIYPVDSEHSAIFQSLQGTPKGKIKKILLTASGGPFFGNTKDDLKGVTPEVALKHPNWDMGAKITIDSATMMNKGLEVIEAMHLFSVSADDIEILVHKQSILHSAVEFVDGAIIGQLGSPDMHIPIQYALTYPDRFECPSKPLSLTDIGTLTFQKPDFDTFDCLSAALKAAKEGGLKPCAINGANELAVAKFLKGEIGFLQIGELVLGALQNQRSAEEYTLEDVIEADKLAREYVLSNI